MQCYRCRDIGIEGGCPDCNKVKEISGNPAVEVTEEVLDQYKVPKFYRASKWNSKVLSEAYPELATHRTFRDYISQLDKIYESFKSGNIPSQSVFIIAPPRRGKQVFAFSCMQAAINHGYACAPVLDSSEWRRLNLLATERPTSKELKTFGCTLEQVLNADILFLTVDKDNFSGAYRAIESLIDKRSRRDKPTIVISRYSLEQMSFLDYDDNFKHIVDKTRRLNQLKYVGLILGE